MAVPRAVLSGDQDVAAAIHSLERDAVRGAPVIDSEGRFRGTVSLRDLRDADPAAPLSRQVDASAASVTESSNLDQAIDALPEGRAWLTVLDEQRRVRGIIAITDVVRAYHAALRRDRDRLSGVSANAGIAEIRVGEGSALIGHPLAESALPDGTIVISVRRADSVLLGLGSVQLRAGDLVTVLARPSRLGAVRELLEPTGPANRS